MSDAELEAMFVRLYGDGSSYSSMLNKADEGSRQTAQNVERYTGRVEHFGNALEGFVANAGQALGALGLTAWLKEGLSAWDEQDRVNRKLDVILRVNGRNVEELTKDYEEFSTAMQRNTKYADEQVLAVLAQAESFGLTGDAAKQATQAAIGLAAINDGNAQSYLRFTAAMARGDTRMMMRMARMIPQLRGIRDQTELMAKAQKLVEAGFELAQKQTETYSGAMKQLHNQYNDFMEDVGKIVTQYILPLIRWTKETIACMQTWDDTTKRIIVTLAFAGAGILAFGPAFAVVRAVGVPALMSVASALTSIVSVGNLLLKPLSLIAAILTFPATPILIALGAAAAVTAVWVSNVGGLQNAWNILKDKAVAAWTYIRESGEGAWTYVKDKAAEFLEWATPAIAAFAGTAAAWWNFLYEVGSVKIMQIWDAVKWVYQQITGSTTVTWTNVRDSVVSALVSTEYFLRNWERTWHVANLSAGYYTTKTFNVIVYYLDTVIPQYLAMFIVAFKEVFVGIAEAAKEFGQSIWDFLTHPTDNDFDLTPLETRLNTAIRNVQSGVGRVPERIVGQIEEQLRREFEASANALGEGWQEFYNRRMQEIGQFRLNLGIHDETDRLERRNPGSVLANSFAAATKEVHKFDSALYGSREAMYRLYEYSDSLERRTAHVGAAAAEAGGHAAAGASSVQAAEPSRIDIRNMEALLRDIRDDARNRPGLQGADL